MVIPVVVHCLWLNISHLVMASSTLLVSAWPRWSLPVTLGGGITIVNTPACTQSALHEKCRFRINSQYLWYELGLIAGVNNTRTGTARGSYTGIHIH
jgi:hypothetical protein